MGELDNFLQGLDEYIALKKRRRGHTYFADMIVLLLPHKNGMLRQRVLDRLESKRRNDKLPIPKTFEANVQSAYQQNWISSFQKT